MEWNQNISTTDARCFGFIAEIEWFVIDTPSSGVFLQNLMKV